MFRILFSLMALLIAANAHAREFLQVPLKVTVEYDSFDEEAPTQTKGFFRFSDDGKFSHVIVRGGDGVVAQFDTALKEERSPSKDDLYGETITMDTDSVADLILKVVPPQDAHRKQIERLVSRYRRDGMAINYEFNSFGSTDSGGYQFHDDRSEESLHLWFEFNTKIEKSGGQP